MSLVGGDSDQSTETIQVSQVNTEIKFVRKWKDHISGRQVIVAKLLRCIFKI